MHDRESRARLYDFESFTFLLDRSTLLPMGESDDFPTRWRQDAEWPLVRLAGSASVAG